MPYEVEKSDECPASEPWAVINPDTGKVYGCHETKKDAREQQEALYVHAPPEEEEEREVTMEDKNPIQQLWEGIKRLFEPLVQERAWSGAASNYADTDAYCKACLIDVNAAAGNDEKKQSHCMLPVKSPGSDSYNEDGCHAAAARFNQVEKPDDVPGDAWDSAVKSAANKLISAYNSFDDTAPEVMYEAAGKERPEEEERATNLGRLYTQIDAALMDSDSWHWLHDLYLDDDGSMFAIVSTRGVLYRVPVELAEEGVTLGEFVKVMEEFKPVGEMRTSIIRQADGRVRWLSVSATSVLNRVGEIDSTALFDSFAKHAQETGEYPFRCFFHQGEAMRTGQVDFLAREGAVLITSGLYDEDNPLAEAEIAALERDPQHWGESIHYRPTEEPEMIEVAEGVAIPVYRAGVMIETSILPRDRAAGWFTTTTIQEVSRMRDDVMEALLELCDGDEKRAKGFAALVDATNREIEEGGLIARAGEPAPDSEPEPEPAEGPERPEGPEEAGREIELDGAAIDAIAAQFAEMLAPLTEKLEGLAGALGELREGHDAVTKEARSARSKLAKRVEALERDDEEKHDEWLADLPRQERHRTRVTYRPREANAPGSGENEERSLADVAEATLAGMPRY